MKQFIILILLAVSFLPSSRATVLLDQIAVYGDLVCFPSVDNPNVHYYLPNQVRIVSRNDGLPEFSFLSCVDNTSQKAGGAIHGIFKVDVDQHILSRAELALRVDNPLARLAGPVNVDKGMFTIVSASKRSDNQYLKEIMNSGDLHISEGSQIAFSAITDKVNTQKIWRSFDLPTADLSVSSFLEIKGLSDPFLGKLVIDFDKVLKHKFFGVNAELSALNFELDLKLLFDDLVEQGSIHLLNRGNDSFFEKIQDQAFEIFLNMMFEKIKVHKKPKHIEPDILDQVVDVASNIVNKAVSKAVPYININVSLTFKIKEIKRSGKLIIDLNKRRTKTHRFRIDYNFGELAKYKDDKRVFKRVNTSENDLMKYTIGSALDISTEQYFEEYIDFVEVTIFGKNILQNELDKIVFDVEDIDKDKLNKYQAFYKKDDPDINHDLIVKWNYSNGESIVDTLFDQLQLHHILVSPISYNCLDLEFLDFSLEDEEIFGIDLRIYDDQHPVQLINKETRFPKNKSEPFCFETISDSEKVYYEYDIIKVNGDKMHTPMLTHYLSSNTIYLNKIL